MSMATFQLTIVLVLSMTASISECRQRIGQSDSTPLSKNLRSKSCSVDEFEECLNQIKSVMDSDEVAYATNIHDLESACRKLQNGLKCADDHMKRCASRSQRQVFEEVVKGTRQVISKLCTMGPVQRNYLKYAGCLKNISKSDSKCGLWFKAIKEMDINVKGVEKDDIDHGLEDFCCVFNQAYQCQVYHLRHDCGSEAVDFFEKNLNEMSNSLIHRHCASFTYSDCVYHSHLDKDTPGSSKRKSSSSLGYPIYDSHFTSNILVSFVTYLSMQFVLSVD